MRVDDQLIEMDQAVQKKILLETEPDWSMYVIPDASIEDLSMGAIEKARTLYKMKNKKIESEVDTWDDITFLNKAKLTIKWQMTRTTILLLWKPESDHYIFPWTSKITWILKDKEYQERDYEHFSCPMILSIDEVYGKIRNLKYRYISWDTIFPDEVDQYDPYIIREALNNCVAHQDYSLGWKILIIENEAGNLIFINSGSFIPKSIENVILDNAPESFYRNKFLTDAMVNLGMIDTIGSGIRKMFMIQKEKFFPLPEYDFSDNKVKLTITWKVLEISYARKLAQMPNLRLDEIILLDKIQKWKTQELKKEAILLLKKKKLIEGRYPNVYISSYVAWETSNKSEYIKLRGFNDTHYKRMILDYLDTYKFASKKDIDWLILDKLPDILDENQKSNKVRNIVYSMSKKDKSILNIGTNRNPSWKKV